MSRFIGGLMALGVVLVMTAGTAGAQEMPKPGKEHEGLQKLVGKWKATVVEGFQAGQTGVTEFKSACNGMWVVSDFTMDDKSFSGHGMDSYDPMKKKYVSVWADSMGGSPLVFEGNWQDDKKTTMVMTAKGPGPDGSPVEYKSVTKYPAEGKMNFVLFMKQGDGEIKLMEMNYVKM